MKVNVRIDNRSFEVDIADVHARPIIATVDGEQFEVWPETTANGSAEKRSVMSATAATPAPQPAAMPKAVPPAVAGNVKEVYAPIPGVIISVAVKPGAGVTPGQELCVLEAMKMKNAIRAGRAGQIAAVHVSAGQTVKHHDVLMEYSE
jgi:biotin carboxyl carrier protein